jgi:hypothetical protein
VCQLDDQHRHQQERVVALARCVLVHDGDATAAKVAERYAAFAKTKE